MEKVCREALTLFPDSPELRVILADLAAELGEDEAALAELDRIIASHPT